MPVDERMLNETVEKLTVFQIQASTKFIRCDFHWFFISGVLFFNSFYHESFFR